MKLAPWLVLISLFVVSCSGSKSTAKVDEETPQIELSDADEFIENPSTEGVATTEAAPEETAAVTDEPVVGSEEPVVSEAAPADLSDTSAIESAPAESVAVMSNEGGTTKTYTVQKNETLMLIAFKLFGDYEKWKELASSNRDVLNGGTSLKTGMTLKYTAPAEEFVWNPQGLPYLIRTGDSLGGISKNVYSTIKKWKLIWENNRPLIKDPNKIFAGFTIYYLENGREVAAQQ